MKDPQQPICDDNLEILRFTRVPFGVISSQFLLCAVVIHHLNKFKSPAAKKILDHIYVDNVVCGVDCEEEALQFYTEAKNIFEKASMNLREWASNCTEFTSAIPRSDNACEERMKVLGLHWHIENDTFRINDSYKKDTQAVTKRQVLKRIAAIFDPVGYFNPVMVKAKLFLQCLWEKNVEWDEDLDDEMKTKWEEINNYLGEICTIEIPRFISCNGDVSYQLLCFCDASKLAYSTAVYLKSTNGVNTNIHLIFSKTRVTPKTKKMSLPRLELLAVRLQMNEVD